MLRAYTTYRVAITTKYLGPTNRVGSRIMATAKGHQLTIPYDDELGSDELHATAALKLMAKMDWADPSTARNIVGGSTPTGMVWVIEGARELLKVGLCGAVAPAPHCTEHCDQPTGHPGSHQSERGAFWHA